MFIKVSSLVQNNKNTHITISIWSVWILNKWIIASILKVMVSRQLSRATPARSSAWYSPAEPRDTCPLICLILASWAARHCPLICLQWLDHTQPSWQCRGWFKIPSNMQEMLRDGLRKFWGLHFKWVSFLRKVNMPHFPAWEEDDLIFLNYNLNHWTSSKNHTEVLHQNINCTSISWFNQCKLPIFLGCCFFILQQKK